MRKRIIALALAVMLFVGLQPEPVMASGGEALRTALSGIVKATAKSTTTMHFPNSYNWHFEVPLLNSRTMNDRTFMNNYVYKDRSEFTATKVFSLYDYSRVDMDRPESNLYLAYNNEYYTFNDLASWFAQYRWYVNSNSNWNFRRLVQEGQISYLYSAELRYSRHMHWKKPGWHNRLRDFAQAIFFYGYNESNQIAMLMNNADQSEGSWNSMSTGWKSMPTYSTDNYLNILLTHDERGNCLCGASSVRRSVLVFADTVAPSITSLSVSGKQYYYNKTTNGGKIRFTVNFNEPIRRSDGVVGDDRNFNTEDMRFWVKLAAYDRETRQSVENAYAKLVEANESSLVFEYTVPDDTDMIITGLAGADRQRDCILKDRGTYKMITNSGSYMEVQGNSGWMKSTAAFTDFAGNGIDLKWRAVSFSQEIHVDTTTPKISSMAIPSGSMMLGQDTTKLPDGWNANSRDDAGWVDNGIDRSQVFAGTGDWLNLYVDFSEELKDLGGSGAMKSANAKYFVATLNILDGSNNPVKLRGTAAESVKLDINNNIPATRLTFETLRITEDMHPADDSKPIRITDINVEGGGYTNANITDMCGNPIDAATIAGITEVVPKQQEWLDTNAPTIMIGNPAKGGYSGRETIKIPINVTENSYNVHSPTLYNSGVTGVGAGGTSAAAGAGTIRLTGMPDESYQWAVTLEDKEPDDGDWKDSNGDTYIEFPQLGTAVYLHLRLKEAPVLPLTDFQITCTGVDWAGNQGTVTETIKATGEGFTNGILLRENVSPSSYVIFDTQINDDGGKDVTARFTVSDKGGLEEVKYKIFVNSAYEVSADTVTVPGWEALIEQARNEGGWTNVQLDPGATSVEVTAGPESCISQYDNCVYLYVYMRDRCGNEWAQSDKFQQDLRMPRFTVTLPRDENGDYVVTEAGKEKIGIGLLDLSDASAMGPVRMASGNYYWYWSYGALMLTLVPKQIGDLESPIYGESKGITKIVDYVLDANQGDKDNKPAPGNAQPQRDDNLYKNIDDVLGELDVADSGGDNIFASDQHHPDLIYPKGYLHYGEGSYPEGVMVGDVGSGYEDTLFKTSASNYVSMNTEEWQTAKEIVEKLKDGYYGELEIHLTEADSLTRGYLGDEWRLEHIPVDEDEKPVYTESYTVKVRTKDYNYKNKYEYYYSKINNVDYGDIVLTNGEVIHSNGWDERTSGYPGRIVEDVPTAFKDLTGIKVNFTLGNNRVPEWGIEDIDFEQSKLVLHYTDQFISGGAPEYEVVREFPLTPDTANQSFIFPDDIEYQDGVYQIEVHLMIKSFQEMEIFNIACPTFNVSTLEPDPDGGIKSVFIVDGQSLKNDTSKELSFYAKNSEDGENVNEFTIPVIQSIDAEGASSSEYFFPFFTYQNMYFNDSTNQVSIVGSGNQKEVVNLMGLKVWTVAEDGTRVDLGEVRYGSDQKQSFLIDPSTTLNTVEEIPSYSYDYKPTNEYLKSQTKNGFTFGLLPSPTYETYKGADGFPNLGEDSGEDVNLMLNAAIKAGETKTFYMQEIYANGEKGSIKTITITAPDITAVPEEGKTTVPVTPVVDVTCSAGVPSDYAYINVNEISSLNGIKSIDIRRNGIENWELWDTAFNFSAEVQEVTETEEYENAQGETESVTYTHLMLAVNDTEMSSDSTTRLGEKTENSSGINMQRLLGLLSKASGSNSGKFADPVLVVMDEKYNVTVRALGDLVDDWDPLGTAMEVEAELDYDEFGNVDFGSLVKDGQYTVPLRLTDKFAPKDLDGMTLYISAVDPSSEPAEGETGTITALNTVAIPFSELAKVENYVTPYDGSTPNAPGVTDIKVKSATVPETYGCDWRNENSYISGGFAYVPDAVDIELEISGSQPDTPLYIYCKDELGHMSISDFYTFEEGVIVLPANTEEGAKPEIIEESIQHADNGSLELKFTQKVTVYDPAIPGGDMTLTAEKTGIPIYKDGVYDITYADIFGKSYTSQIKVALDGDYQFVYSMTPDELTNQQVTFKIDTLSNGIEDTVINGVRVKDPSGADTLAEGTDYTVEFNGEAGNKTATVVMQENGIIEVDLQYNQQSTTKRFPITNIDKEMEEVEVVWEYDSYDVYQTREVDNTDTTDDPNDKTIEYVTDEEGNLVLKERGAQTTGYVTAVLQLKNRDSDEVLIGTNGDLRYTFPNLSAAESTYTFEYMDAAGNTGIMEAKLPYSIKLPVPPRLSGYEMDISHTALTQTYNDLSFGYRVREDDVVQTLPDFETLFQNPEANNAIVQAREILINLSTELDAAVYVLGPDATEEQARAATASEAIDGVTVAGRNISVTKNAGFTIAVVEDIKYYNAALMEPDDTHADTSPQKVYLIPVNIRNIPELDKDSVSIEYVKQSEFRWWAYLDPGTNRDDTGNSLLTVTNVIGATEAQEDPLKHLYYHEFLKNGSYVFYYRDEVGHTGQIEATMDKIPADPTPRVIDNGVRWWPYDGKNQAALTRDPVNFDVTYQLTFNMLINEASISKDGSERLTEAQLKAAEEEYELAASLNTVTVTFHKNTTQKLWVWVKGETDVEAFVQIGAEIGSSTTAVPEAGPVSIIDKTAPTVTAEIVKPDPDDPTEFTLDDGTAPTRSVYLRFTPDEQVVCNEFLQDMSTKDDGSASDGYYTGAKPLVVYVTENGEYEYTFTDRAGNTKTSEKITVTNIDNEAPTVVFADSNGGEGQSWEEYAKTKGDDIKKLENVWVKITDDKCGTCTYTFQNAKNATITSGEWTMLTIERKLGGFMLTASDMAGNTTVAAMQGILLKDTTAPKLFVSPQSISIPQGLSEDELEEMLCQGVDWSDDMTEYDEVDCKLDKSSFRDEAGEYVIRFTATDEQDNSTTVERYVRVYPTSSLLLRVRGDNETEFRDTGYMNTVIMRSTGITFEISNLRGTNADGFEPCTVYVKKGMKTSGQMKNNSTKVPLTNAAQDGKLVCSYDFGETASGYYTVYIVTQDRTQYLTYLYIE